MYIHQQQKKMILTTKCKTFLQRLGKRVNKNRQNYYFHYAYYLMDGESHCTREVSAMHSMPDGVKVMKKKCIKNRGEEMLM